MAHHQTIPRSSNHSRSSPRRNGLHNNKMSTRFTMMTIVIASLYTFPASVSAFSSSHCDKGLLTSSSTTSSLRMVLMDPDTLMMKQRKSSHHRIQNSSSSSHYHRKGLHHRIPSSEVPTYDIHLDNLIDDLESSIQNLDQAENNFHSPISDDMSHEQIEKKKAMKDSSLTTTTKTQLEPAATPRFQKASPNISSSKGSDSDLQQSNNNDKNDLVMNNNDVVTGQTKATSSRNHKLLKPISSVSSKQKVRKEPKNKISRSSTMPGFAERSNTGRMRRFNDGLKVFEEKSGRSDVRKMLTKKDATAKGRRANAEAMYLGSASVPESLMAFTSEIHKVQRITPTEEIELGTKTQEAIELQRIFEALETELEREPTDDEWCAAAGKINMEAIRQAIEEGVEAKNRLVTSNLRMVQGVVNLYIRNGLGSQYNAADLMQEGIIALIRAAEKFEPSRGFRFSTYAMYWIRAAVKRSQILQSRVIHVPQRLHETNKKILTVEKELCKELGRKPKNDELADAVGITVAQLTRCRKALAQECFSLDSNVENTLKPNSGDKSSGTMYDLIDAKSEDEELKKLDQLFMREDLISTLRRYLSPHEVDLILLRYGLMDERALPEGFSGPLTIADVSRLVGLKPDKVRRIINNCLRQLRHLIANEWEDFEKEFS